MRYSPNSSISLRFNPGNDEDGAGASSIHSRSERSSWYMWAKMASSSHLRQWRRSSSQVKGGPS